MQLFAHSKKHASPVHTVLHAQVQKSVPGLTKSLKKIRVSELAMGAAGGTIGAALRGRPRFIHGFRKWTSVSFANPV